MQMLVIIMALMFAVKSDSKVMTCTALQQKLGGMTDEELKALAKLYRISETEQRRIERCLNRKSV